MVSKWQGLVIASLLTQPVMADSGQGSQAAAVIIPLIFIACPVVAALVLKRELPKPLHPVTTFACNIVALVSFSCAGHSIGLSHYDEKPFATSGNKYITAIGVICWLYFCLFAGVLLLDLYDRFTKIARLMVVVSENTLIVLCLAASIEGFAHWNGHNDYCKIEGSKQNYCNTYRAGVAFMWMLFWGIAIRLYFAISHYIKEPSGTRSQTSRSDGAEQNYDVLEEGSGVGDEASTESKWQEYTDDTTGRPYWHNADTGVSTWTRPHAQADS
ncbi:hypothetical protein AAMO2058_000123200 [Amorphochlora amoebiformis]|uniref:WW domain-containing protein n=1 Tax=Amorphochlora amoebiformis TaxID=1561963 RepID=A0A7S0GYM4_9EUKA|mmetsp:Transcript_22972/g.36092  ORF Transcript_22972/g.36092 Transcript_22972/m.36092 type:complete len:271 (+) Transcript_22972:1-813(+)